jgi:hypothetical protein
VCLLEALNKFKEVHSITILRLDLPFHCQCSLGHAGPGAYGRR